MSKHKPKRSHNPRPIITTYYFRNKVVKINRSSFADTATENAFVHLQFNDYGATSCDIVHETYGRLYAVLRRKLWGDVVCEFKTGLDFVTRDNLEEMRRKGLVK